MPNCCGLRRSSPAHSVRPISSSADTRPVNLVASRMGAGDELVEGMGRALSAAAALILVVTIGMRLKMPQTTSADHLITLLPSAPAVGRPRVVDGLRLELSKGSKTRPATRAPRGYQRKKLTLPDDRRVAAARSYTWTVTALDASGQPVTSASGEFLRRRAGRRQRRQGCDDSPARVDVGPRARRPRDAGPVAVPDRNERGPVVRVAHLLRPFEEPELRRSGRPRTRRGRALRRTPSSGARSIDRSTGWRRRDPRRRRRTRARDRHAPCARWCRGRLTPTR